MPEFAKPEDALLRLSSLMSLFISSLLVFLSQGGTDYNFITDLAVPNALHFTLIVMN